MVARFEGFRSRAYRDVGGVWTVGYGETRLDGRAVQAGDEMPEPQARERLAERLAFFAASVRGSCKRELSQNQLDACTSLAYNIGCEAFRTSTVCHKIQVGDFDGAADSFKLWNKVGKIVRAGLVARRAEEAALFRAG